MIVTYIKAKKKSATIEVQLAVTNHDSVPFSMTLLTCSLSTQLLLGTKTKLYLWKIPCRSLNNAAVTSKRTLVVLRVLRINVCRTILKVRISIALTRNNSFTNIELKYRGSFLQDSGFRTPDSWFFLFGFPSY